MLRKKTLALALRAAWGIQLAAWAENQNSTPETMLEEVSVSATSSGTSSEATGSYAVQDSSAAIGLDLSLRETAGGDRYHARADGRFPPGEVANETA